LKAGLVEKAETYRWSSAKAHITGAVDNLLGATSWLSPHEQDTYAEFVAAEDEETDNAIRKATRTGRPFGSESFVDLLEFQLKQPLKARRKGRPYKTSGECH
jgi:putative transposase